MPLIRVPLQESGQSSTSGDTFFFKRQVPLQVRRRGESQVHAAQHQQVEDVKHHWRRTGTLKQSE
jgi:hypothetical protein